MDNVPLHLCFSHLHFHPNTIEYRTHSKNLSANHRKIAESKTNKKSAGFTEEERASFDNIVEAGFIDTFRYFCKEPKRYSWWSYRANARSKNLGWRIDYNMIANILLPKLEKATILAEVIHSDHCPIMIEISD